MKRIQSAATVLLLVIAVPVQAANPAAKCESKKLKETAKYASCRLKAHATAVTKNLPPDFSKCDGKYASKFELLEEKAGAGVCPSENDAASIQARVTGDTNDLATLLDGGSLATCGDSVIAGGEECDWRALNGETCVSRGYAGGDLDCHPGSCTFDVSDCIPAGCGNGTVEPGEICDGDCPTCDPQPPCFENTGDESTCDLVCSVPVQECRQTDDGCCPYGDAGSGCSSATDSDCAGSGWEFLEWPLPVSWNAGQCTTVSVFGVQSNDSYLFTTCRPDGPATTNGDPVIASVADDNGQEYSVANDDCTVGSAIPKLAGWLCTNMDGSPRDACAPANSGGFLASSSPISRIDVEICGHNGTAGNTRLFIWYNGTGNPNPG